MKQLKDIILEKLIINKHSKLKTHILLTKDNLELIQKVFRFYVENFISDETIHKICKKNKIDKERYEYTINEINDIIANAERENRSVASILFNNEFKHKENIQKIKDLFISITKEIDNSFIEQMKEQLLEAFIYWNK